jgi:hypothetical protein
MVSAATATALDWFGAYERDEIRISDVVRAILEAGLLPPRSAAADTQSPSRFDD